MDKKNANMINRLTCVLSALLNRWNIIILVMLLCGCGLDVFKTVTYQPMYSCSIQGSLGASNNTYANVEEAKTFSTTLNYVFNSDLVRDAVNEKLGVKSSDYTCTVTGDGTTNIVNVTSVAPTKQEAYLSVKNIVSWYKKNRKKYEFKFKFTILEDATIAETPYNPNSHVNNVIRGAAISGVLSILLIALLAYFDDTVKTSDDINKLDTRLFAKIPYEKKTRGIRFWKRNKKAILITSLKTSFQYKESIKKLATKLSESAKKHNYKVIMVTSSLENEGKSSVAANIALALANTKKNVLLMDCDLRKPSVHKIFDMSNEERNINNYMNQVSTWDKQLYYTKNSNLFMMFAKPDVDHSEEILSSERMKKLIQAAKESFDYVIIDSSPSAFINDALVINEECDATLVVVRQEEAKLSIISKTITRLVNAKNNVIGVVYNAKYVDFVKKSKTYGHRYGYDKYSNRRREK